MKYTSRITQMIVHPVGKALFSKKATIVSIYDEGAGEFITVKQHYAGGEDFDRIQTKYHGIPEQLIEARDHD